MFSFLIHIFFTITVLIMYFLFTVAFCFWSIYLIDAIRRQRACYKNALKCLEDQHIQTYNARTELVKYVIIFCMNILEWMGCNFTLINYTINSVSNFRQLNDSVSDSGSFNQSIINTRFHVPDLYNLCIVMCMTFIGILCMYLAARQARIRWIKSNTIPYWICFFLLCSIATQILITVCYTSIIGEWLDRLLTGIVVIFAWKQYRKLDMVIQWSIVDLRVRGDIVLLDKHVRMKRFFNKTFEIIWIGALLVFSSKIIQAIRRTTQIILHPNNDQVLILFTCEFENSNYSNPDLSVITILFGLEYFLSATGCFIFFIPYIGYGLKKMFITIWRLFRGKSGFRTRFSYQLNAPLISTTRRNVSNI